MHHILVIQCILYTIETEVNLSFNYYASENIRRLRVLFEGIFLGFGGNRK